ncbi:hypothetical protein N7468_000955 [Penicillium chermesinum]|uniref:Clavaminate synthase-like protein n=1 Tax=Penicillium chermesinum TaxID=63820 RepID=A0A9W9PGR9_9EURO|nr:uncharacterized protein N7468_000955 [Penicillium chermesinum]KAJ5245972.1 hypothetical protein N7468_000955 [Penicillium chermesinum]
MNAHQAPVAQPVTVSFRELVAGPFSPNILTEAFGPSSLGILVVCQLPEKFVHLRKRVLSSASYLAALSEAELQSLESPESKYLVGWSCGKETLKSGQFDTLKGSYYVNCAFHQDSSLDSAPADGFPDLPQYTAPNIWPPSDRLPGFRSDIEELCSLIIQVATLVANACDRYAENNIEGYTPFYLRHVVETSFTTKARLLHYFPSENDTEENASDDDWCATHVDHGCLTGLTSAMFLDEAATPPVLESPDPAAGLYIESRTGEIVKVNIPKDCLAFQTGKALELITRGKFRAVPHFVKGARRTGRGSRIARNTLAVFTQPNLGEEVEPGLTFGEFARATVQKNY